MPKMSTNRIHDWIDALMIACPGFSQRKLDGRETRKSRFFWNWFLDMSAQWL